MCGTIHSSNKKAHKMEDFYLKVWITLLNEMLQLLFMPCRHLRGLFPGSIVRVLHAGLCSGCELDWFHVFFK